jgi:hypothetical protein
MRYEVRESGSKLIMSKRGDARYVELLKSGDSLALMTESLLCMKAADEYIRHEGSTKQMSLRRLLNSQARKCQGYMKGFRLSQKSIEDLPDITLSEVTQDEISEAFRYLMGLRARRRELRDPGHYLWPADDYELWGIRTIFGLAKIYSPKLITQRARARP